MGAPGVVLGVADLEADWSDNPFIFFAETLNV